MALREFILLYILRFVNAILCSLLRFVNAIIWINFVIAVLVIALVY